MSSGLHWTKTIVEAQLCKKNLENVNTNSSCYYSTGLFTSSLCSSIAFPGNSFYVQLVCHSGLTFVLFFLLQAHHHPAGVLVSQGASRAAYHSGADVSSECNTLELL